MSFIDEIKFYAKAGDGGKGVVRWRREKFKPLCGPGGGDGGRGGNVYAEAVRDIYVLTKYKHQKKFIANDGEAGGNFGFHGANGEDQIIKLPIGSIVRNLNTNEEISLEKEGQKELILVGGKGGFGNEHFKASTNTTPQESTPGLPGEDAEFFVELQLFADIGLIGLPNAGKSSLLNFLTNAEAKVGDYPFTTLDPNLGDFYGYIIADIPGLIEGAAEGKGLGIKFLRHIKRTKILAHLVSFENLPPVVKKATKKTTKKVVKAKVDEMMRVYKEVRKELEKYDKELAKKQEIIILTKTDAVDKKTIDKELKIFKKFKKPVFVLSLYDDKTLKVLKDGLTKILKKAK